MAHHSRLDKIVIDVAPADHGNEVAFWSGVTGRPLSQSGHGTTLRWAPPRPEPQVGSHRQRSAGSGAADAGDELFDEPFVAAMGGPFA
jgi:hypothetical protein